MKRDRLALWVWYRGDRFQGWQSQGTGRSVQEHLAAGLAVHGISGSPMGAGRTDRGVHARCQPVSVRLRRGTSLEAVRDVGGQGWGVAAAALAPDGFHAQWSSVSKEYRYRLALGPVPERWSAHAWDPSTHPRIAGARVDRSAARWALERALGTRDFSALHAASSVRRPRTLQAVHWTEAGALIEIGLVGNAFGRYGVRLLVGGAVLVGAGVVAPAAWERALDEAARFEGLRAPAAALTLWAVGYPPPLDPFATAAPRLPGSPPFVAVDQA